MSPNAVTSGLEHAPLLGQWVGPLGRCCTAKFWLGYILLLAAFLPAGSSAAGQGLLSPEQAELVYELHMTAEFDHDSGRINGSQHLSWRNTTSRAISELRFHLYLNAFSGSHTSFMLSSGRRHHGLAEPGERWGWTEVSSITLQGTGENGAGTELKGSEQFLAPDDGNSDDRTVVSYQLPSPVTPGQTIELDIEFVSKLPPVIARSGRHGDYLLAGQWFPKIGVLQEDGWSCHQYARGEFFADFGSYDVTLVLPARYQGKIGATGELIDEWRDGDRVYTRFTATGVLDFVWAADPRFEVVRERFDPERDVPQEQREQVAALLGSAPGELRLRPVELILLVQPAHRHQARRYLDAAKATLAGLGLRLGAYPYPTLTLVDPARGAFASGGMEYPTLVTLGTHPLFDLPPFAALLFPEAITVHEIGHQYFQGMVASNEVEESWLDEGLTTYYEMVIMEEYRARRQGSLLDLGFELSPLEENRLRMDGSRVDDAIVTPSWAFLSSGSYGDNSYFRPALTLRHLENLVGPQVFHPAMRRYFQTWCWKHPTSSDFIHSFETAAAQDLGWFFDQVLYTDHTLDYAVVTAESDPVRPRQGVVVEDGEEIVIDDAAAPGLFVSTVVVRRQGEMWHPIEVELVFEDGHRERRQWDGKGRWMRWDISHTATLVSAELDPEQRMVLDRNRLNNSLRCTPRTLGRRKLMTHLLFWLQNLFDAASLLG